MRELKFETHLITYQLDGISWSIEVRASSADDAMRRLRRAAYYGSYDGVLQASIPAFPGAGILVRALTWWRNWRR